MKSFASLALILTVPAFAQEPPLGDGPRGSSQAAPGEAQFDAVGRAVISDRTSVRGLQAGDYAEVTALDSGKTIVIALDETAGDTGGLVMVSSRVATALALSGPADVRVRKVAVTPPEVAQLRGGEIVTRIDAPPALLAGLRKRMAPAPTAPPSSSSPPPPPAPPKSVPLPRAAAKPAPEPRKPAPPPAVVASGKFWVQVASLSTQSAARALAAKVGGTVSPIGRLYRVRVGPLADRVSADRARLRVTTLGYRDATVIKPD